MVLKGLHNLPLLIAAKWQGVEKHFFPEGELRQEVSCVWEDILFGEVFSSRLTFVLPERMVPGNGGFRFKLVHAEARI